MRISRHFASRNHSPSPGATTCLHHIRKCPALTPRCHTCGGCGCVHQATSTIGVVIGNLGYTCSTATTRCTRVSSASWRGPQVRCVLQRMHHMQLRGDRLAGPLELRDRRINGECHHLGWCHLNQILLRCQPDLQLPVRLDIALTRVHPARRSF